MPPPAPGRRSARASSTPRGPAEALAARRSGRNRMSSSGSSTVPSTSHSSGASSSPASKKPSATAMRTRSASSRHGVSFAIQPFHRTRRRGARRRAAVTNASPHASIDSAVASPSLTGIVSSSLRSAPARRSNAGSAGEQTAASTAQPRARSGADGNRPTSASASGSRPLRPRARRIVGSSSVRARRRRVIAVSK